MATICQADGSKTLWSISPSIAYYRYNEPNVMQSKGPTVGLNAQLDHQQSNGLTWIVNLYLEYAHGYYSSKYTGSHEADTSYLFRLSPLVGYRFLLNSFFKQYHLSA